MLQKYPPPPGKGPRFYCGLKAYWNGLDPRPVSPAAANGVRTSEKTGTGPELDAEAGKDAFYTCDDFPNVNPCLVLTVPDHLYQRRKREDKEGK
ncbi:MAG: hypothetical protein LBC55_07310 [Desulfovibrio sp.]|nr:hypothetical protein [Desulfovibrio sp.]